jgi:hypothetical protein
MSRIGRGVVHLVDGIVSAPASATTAAFTRGYLVANFLREMFNRPTWEVDHSDVQRLDRQLADLVDRYPAKQALDTPSSVETRSSRNAV